MIQINITSEDESIIDNGKKTIVSHNKNSVVTEKKMEKILKSPINPLFDIAPPMQLQQVENLVLVQAEEMKKDLEKIFAHDPTARCHFFSFQIYPANKELLEKNGYHVNIIEPGTPRVLTEVSWKNPTTVFMSIPVKI